MAGERKAVMVEIREVYGVKMAYPKNEAAKLFAEIAGTKSLKHHTLALAERLGFAIVDVSVSKLAEVA